MISSVFTNLVKALANNAPLVLLDSDLNPAELDGVDENRVNVPALLEVKKFASMQEVIEALQQSISDITILRRELPDSLGKWFTPCRP